MGDALRDPRPGAGETPNFREFFRVDQGPSFRRVLLPAVLLLTVGPPLILFSATMKQMRGHAVLGFVGAMLMVAGLLTGFVGIGVLLADDRWIGVTDEGIVVHVGREDVSYAWSSLAKIGAADGHLVLELVEGEAARIPFGRTALDPIAARLEDWRRKSAWNLAPSPPG